MYDEANTQGLSEADRRTALRSERKLEKAWSRIRESRTSLGNNGTTPINERGWLDPFSPEALTLAVRDEIPGAIVVAIESFKHLVDEARIFGSAPSRFASKFVSQIVPISLPHNRA